LKANISKQLEFFKAADESWEIIEDTDLKQLVRDARLEAMS